MKGKKMAHTRTPLTVNIHARLNTVTPRRRKERISAVLVTLTVLATLMDAPNTVLIPLALTLWSWVILLFVSEGHTLPRYRRKGANN